MSRCCALTAALVMCVVCARQSFGQTMEELFELHSHVVNNRKNNRVGMEKFYVDMAHQLFIQLKFKKEPSIEDKILKDRLETVLEPLLTLQQAIKETGTLPDNGKEFYRLLKDPLLARQTFDVIGPEYVAGHLQKQMLQSINQRIKDSQLRQSESGSLLVDEVIAEVLGLNEKQKEQIKKSIEATDKKIREGTSKEFEDLEKLYREHWEKICRDLNTKQREKAVALIGEPIHWFRNPGGLPFLSDESGFVRFMVINSKVRNLARSLGKTMADLNEDELAEADVDFFYNHFFQMMRTRFVWDELELSESQRNRLQQDFRLQSNENLYVINGQEDKRLVRIIKEVAKFPSYVHDSFNDKQQQWLKNLEIQLLTFKYRSTIGILHPEIVSDLEITSAQQTKIKKLGEQFDKKRIQIEQNIVESQNKIKSEMLEEIGKVLSEKQREVYKNITGQNLLESSHGSEN